jgi:hypothetical protein
MTALITNFTYQQVQELVNNTTNRFQGAFVSKAIYSKDKVIMSGTVDVDGLPETFEVSIKLGEPTDGNA